MIGAGGTGGHVYPALAAAEALQRRVAEAQITFVGTVGGGGIERRLVEESGVAIHAYEEVPAGPIVGVNPLRALSSLAKMSVGVLKALGFMRRYRPQALLLTGGWANVPVALAAWLSRVPMVIYLPDVEPASTIQTLKHLATRVAITVPDSARFFRKGQTVVTGYPLGQRIITATREQALAHFRLNPAKRTLLVFGGSRGSQNINLALEAILPDLLALNLQIIHITGTLDWERSQAATQAYHTHPDYHALAYVNEMGLAFAGADLAVCRSGASTLGELPYFGLPAILIPYPYAWRYQKTNADYLTERGAAVRVDDATMATDLLPTIRHLLVESKALAPYQVQARNLAQPYAAERLAQVLQDVIRE